MFHNEQQISKQKSLHYSLENLAFTYVMIFLLKPKLFNRLLRPPYKLLSFEKNKIREQKINSSYSP
jgi:hypothetical protein